MSIKSTYLFFFLVLLVHLTSCKSYASETDTVAVPDAITIFHNGEILTVNENNQKVEAIAIAGEKIVGVGNLADITNQFQNAKQIKQVDLKGNTLMPGLYDSHCHPVLGGMRTLHQVQFPYVTDPDTLTKILTNYIADNKPAYVMGGAWAPGYFDIVGIKNPKAWLDNISTEIPILLHDLSYHNLWVNTTALAIGEITADTPDPKNGKIGRFPDGSPNGVLFENAALMVEKKIEHGAAKYREAIQFAQNQALDFGIIAMKDALVDEHILKAFKDFDDSGDLDMYIALCQFSGITTREKAVDPAKFIAAAKENKTDNIDASFIKFYLDGVPTSSKTAAMLCSYKGGEHNHGAEETGMLHLAPELINEEVALLDKAGFTIKIHAAGDRAARVAVDAIAHARNQNGMNNRIHELAHAELIRLEDINRMKGINMAADISPYVWYPSPILDNVRGAVCEDMEDAFFQINTIKKAGVHTIAGSDWPAAAMSLNPWIGLEAMITRKNPMTDGDEAYLPDEAISLEEAIRIFTINGAKSMNRADVGGSLEVGKFADFIVLDKTLTAIDPKKITDIKVLDTYYKGVKRN